MSTRQRLSASIDANLLAQAAAAVEKGAARNLSAWINDAVRMKLEHDRRMSALDDFISHWEKKYGVITERDISEAERWAESRTIRVRRKRRRTA